MKKPRYWDVRRLVKESEREFTAQEVVDALNASLLSDLQDVPLDGRYWGASEAAWRGMLAYTGVDRKRYIKDRFDCDNFAVLFAGRVADKFGINGVGIVIDYSGGHAYCAILIVDENGNLSIGIIEPQNDQFVLKTEGMYSAKFGFIFLP
ncbi:hypothetical protein C6503_19220 [Candidatus Poribacteria bacterium]|nr:MAG: hypothetical protein C6503_19220 [Candidatus Poribacteria bacterium]